LHFRPKNRANLDLASRALSVFYRCFSALGGDRATFLLLAITGYLLAHYRELFRHNRVPLRINRKTE